MTINYIHRVSCQILRIKFKKMFLRKRMLRKNLKKLNKKRESDCGVRQKKEIVFFAQVQQIKIKIQYSDFFSISPLFS